MRLLVTPVLSSWVKDPQYISGLGTFLWPLLERDTVSITS